MYCKVGWIDGLDRLSFMSVGDGFLCLTDEVCLGYLV